jgi:hypothetical protein
MKKSRQMRRKHGCNEPHAHRARALFESAQSLNVESMRALNFSVENVRSGKSSSAFADPALVEHDLFGRPGFQPRIESEGRLLSIVI